MFARFVVVVPEEDRLPPGPEGRHFPLFWDGRLLSRTDEEQFIPEGGPVEREPVSPEINCLLTDEDDFFSRAPAAVIRAGFTARPAAVMGGVTGNTRNVVEAVLVVELAVGAAQRIREGVGLLVLRLLAVVRRGEAEAEILDGVTCDASAGEILHRPLVVAQQLF